MIIINCLLWLKKHGEMKQGCVGPNMLYTSQLQIRKNKFPTMSHLWSEICESVSLI